MQKNRFVRLRLIFVLLMLLLSSSGVAEVAICEEVGSRAFGQDGSINDFERIDELEINQRTYEIRWSESDRSASVLVANRFFYQSEFFRTTDDLVTFLVKDATNTWLYSVYPNAKRAIVSHHMTDIFGGDGGVVVFSGLLECNIGEE